MSRNEFDWLSDTYWYVPHETLAAVRALNGPEPVVERLKDQTVWHLHRCRSGYVTGISATNIGSGWSYNLIAGSVAPGGRVKLSFSPLDMGSSAPPTIGDGTLTGTGHEAVFLMQMTSGTTAMNVSHWSFMNNVTRGDPAWRALPGYPETGVADLTALHTPIRMD